MQRKPSKAYWKGYQAIYGTKIGLSEPKASGSEINAPSKAPIKPKIKKCPSERYEQIVAVTWLRKHGIVVHHSPNGGRRDAREGAAFKAMGVSAGFPDLTLPYARNGYHGLYIEVKTVIGGRLQESQIEWGEFLKNQGYAWYEAKGAVEVVQIVCDYLGINKDAR